MLRRGRAVALEWYRDREQAKRRRGHAREVDQRGARRHPVSSGSSAQYESAGDEEPRETQSGGDVTLDGDVLRHVSELLQQRPQQVESEGREAGGKQHNPPSWPVADVPAGERQRRADERS